MGAILSVLLPLIPGLVQGIEKIFQKPATPVPGAPVPTGTDKMDAVVQSLRAILEKMLATGAVPAPAAPVTDDALRGAVEAVLQQLKASGQLAAPATSGALYLVQGTITPLRAA